MKVCWNAKHFFGDTLEYKTFYDGTLEYKNISNDGTLEDKIFLMMIYWSAKQFL